MPEWTLTYTGFNPAEEKLREALCTLGNGYFFARGAAPESRADGIHYPGTYIAGGYNRLETDISGRVVQNEDLVNMPNWLGLNFRIGDDDWFNIHSAHMLTYRQDLHLKTGLLSRSFHFRDRSGRESIVESRRLVHMNRKHLAALETRINAVNWAGRLQIRSSLDGTVVNDGVERYRKLNSRHLEPVRSGLSEGSIPFLLVRTNQSLLHVAQAARTLLFTLEGERDASRRVDTAPGYIAEDLFVEMASGDAVSVEKVIGLHTSRDPAISETVLNACEDAGKAERFDALLESHELAWRHLWERCDMELGADERTRMVLRLHLFHLLQVASPNTVDLDVGIPARGWHGEAYRGHIFWDELFILPFLNLRFPEVARSRLLYRFRRLEGARKAAEGAGLRGALYPWQSGSDGREETQTLRLNPRSGRWLPDHSRLQLHVNAAIAYNIWQYFAMTGDRAFLRSFGAEVIFEIARMLARRTSYDTRENRYEIHGVVGPDEYHEAYPDALEPGLKNNAYTNVMTAWVLRTALRVMDLLGPEALRELREKIKLEDREVKLWGVIPARMKVPFHDDGIISQFEGYERLAPFDWAGYRKKYGDIHRLDRILEAEGDSPNRYQASKQADVLMLFYLFSAEQLQELFSVMGYDFDPAAIPRNIHYYLERTSNGSTLSNVVHSWVLSRSDRIESWKLFKQALESDISDIQGGTTHEGIHLGAMAGTVDLIQRCYTGLEFRDGAVHLNPRIPAGLRHLRMKLQVRGSRLEVVAKPRAITIARESAEDGEVTIGYLDERYALMPGGALNIDLPEPA
jgi:trehalose/maltose hydrolase-like predicted phosphorylase